MRDLKLNRLIFVLCFTTHSIYSNTRERCTVVCLGKSTRLTTPATPPSEQGIQSSPVLLQLSLDQMTIVQFGKTEDYFLMMEVSMFVLAS